MAPKILYLEVMGLRIPSSESCWKIQTAAARRNLSNKKKQKKKMITITMPTKKKKKANRKEKRPRTGAERRRNDEPSGDVGVPIAPPIAVAIVVVMRILRIPAMRIEEGGNEGNEGGESRHLDATPRGGERIPGGDANENATKILVAVGTNGLAGRKDRKGIDQNEESSGKAKI